MHDTLLAAASGKDYSPEEDRGHLAHYAERVYFWHRTVGRVWLRPE